MTITRINKPSDATWARSWEVADATELATLLATYTDPLGPKRGDIIVQLDEGLIFLLVGANLVVQVNNLATLQGTNAFTGANSFSNFAIELNSGQIQFPTPQVPSAVGTVLDDYKEDVFTPDLTFGGASTGITYTFRQFTLTKVGRQVCVCGLIVLSNKGSATGDVAFTLPYPVSTGNQFASANGMNFDAMAVTVNNAIASCINGTSTAFIFQTAAGTTTRLNETNFTNTSVLVIQVNYFTD